MSELQDLKDEAAALRAELARTADAEAELQAVRVRIAEAHTRNAALKDECDTLRARLEELQAAGSDVPPELAEVRAKLAAANLRLSNPAEAPRVQSAPPAKTRAQLEHEYNQFPSGTVEGAAAREAFREAHREVLGL